jgi:hypothetical protein
MQVRIKLLCLLRIIFSLHSHGLDIFFDSMKEGRYGADFDLDEVVPGSGEECSTCGVDGGGQFVEGVVVLADEEFEGGPAGGG